MEAEPYIPLPKQNVNQPLVFNQLLMLWIIWAGGLTAALFAFFGELIFSRFGQISEDQKKLTTRIDQDGPMASQPALDMEKKYGKRSRLNLEVE